MVEREHEDALRRIQQNLASNQGERQMKSGAVDSVRLQLETIAKEAATKYQRETEATRPDAETAVNEIIQPWFSDFISSGIYSGLIDWARTHEHTIRFSDPILYYWPDGALRALASGNNIPFQHKAELAVEDNRWQDIQKAIRFYADGDTVWSADFHLATSKWNKSEHIRIARRPLDGRGGFWLSAGRYEIAVDAHNFASSFDRISPEVWVTFGNQIQNRDALHAIEQSMQPADTDQSAVNTWREDFMFAQRYLKNRQWH